MDRPDLTRRGATALGLAALAAPQVALAASPADARFQALGARYIEELVRGSPIGATQLGDHRFDAELDDLSAAARQRRTAAHKALLREFETLKPAALSRANQVDLALVKNRLAAQIWTDEVLQEHAWDPQVYSGAAGGALYGLMAREFAP